MVLGGSKERIEDTPDLLLVGYENYIQVMAIQYVLSSSLITQVVFASDSLLRCDALLPSGDDQLAARCGVRVQVAPPPRSSPTPPLANMSTLSTKRPFFLLPNLHAGVLRLPRRLVHVQEEGE